VDWWSFTFGASVAGCAFYFYGRYRNKTNVASIGALLALLEKESKK
jgi:hypothetical protein